MQETHERSASIFRHLGGLSSYRFGALAVSSGFLFGCASAPKLEPGLPDVGVVHEITPDLHVCGLAPGVWLHTTYRMLGGQVRFPSNGLIVDGGTRLYLVDSAWGEQETRTLVEWLEEAADRRLSLMLATHHHDDRASGIAFLQARGVRVVAHPETRSLASQNGLGAPESLPDLSSEGGSVRLGPLEVFYPGAAHTLDNVVVGYLLPVSYLVDARYGPARVRRSVTPMTQTSQTGPRL